MKKRRILPLLLILILFAQLLCFPAAAQEVDLNLHCRNAVLMDAETGELIYSMQPYEKAYPASMTKIMTSLLAFEALEAGTITLDTVVTVSENAATQIQADEASVSLQSGEKMGMKDLLHCLLMPSANDAAIVLAEHLVGSCDVFVDKMNQRAAELGSQNTHFANVNGLHDPDHYTCAYDLALFFREAMSHPLFRQILSTPEYTTAPTNMSDERELRLTNDIVASSYYSGRISDNYLCGKTGSTSSAGKCLTSAVEIDDMVLISVIMGSGPYEDEDGVTQAGHYVETIRLLEYGFDNFYKVTLAQPDAAVASVEVTLSEDGKEVALIPSGSLTRVIPNSVPKGVIEQQVTLLADTVEAPVEAGQVMGTIAFSHDGETLGEVDLVAESSLSLSEKLLRKQNRRAFWAKNWGWFVFIPLLILLLPVAALCVLRYINIQRAKRRRMRRKAARAAAQRRAHTK